MLKKAKEFKKFQNLPVRRLNLKLSADDVDQNTYGAKLYRAMRPVVIGGLLVVLTVFESQSTNARLITKLQGTFDQQNPVITIKDNFFRKHYLRFLDIAEVQKDGFEEYYDTPENRERLRRRKIKTLDEDEVPLVIQRYRETMEQTLSENKESTQN